VRLPLRRKLKELDSGPLAAVDVNLQRGVVALGETDEPGVNVLKFCFLCQ